MKALLLSGGLDSSALAYWLKPDICLTINYGQRAARGEIAASSALCKQLGLQYEVIDVNLSALGSGAMAGKGAVAGAAAVEFWPYRNQMLVTLAAMSLMPRGVTEIMIGAVSTDRHADGRAPFLRSIDRTLAVQEGGLRLVAPARRMSTVKLLETSAFPFELIGLTFSCHVHEYACGQCGGCTKHRECIERAYQAERHH